MPVIAELSIVLIFFALFIAALWSMVSGLFGGMRRHRPWAPNFLDPSAKKEERTRRRSSAYIETAILISVYPSLILRVGLDQSMALPVLIAFCVGLYICPQIARYALGLMAGFLAIIAGGWLDGVAGALPALVIIVYFFLSVNFAPDR